MFMHRVCGSVALVLAGCVLAASGASESRAAVINEMLISPTGSDTEDYAEIRGTPGGSTDGLWLVHIRGTTNGEIYFAFDLSGYTFGANGLFVARGSQSPFMSFAANAGSILPAQDGLTGGGSSSWLLVSGFTGYVNQELDLNRDGIFDSTPWTSLQDSVGWAESGDRVYSPANLTLPSNRAPHAISRFNGSPDDLTPLSAAAWYFGQVVGDNSLLYRQGRVSPNFASNTSGGLVTPGELNVIPAPGLSAWVGGGALLLARRRRRAAH